jgi:hypothetical protein
MLKGMAYMLCILVCAFLPVSLIGVTFVKELTLDEAVSSIVYRFHSNWRIYILFVLMSALKNKQNKSALKESVILLNSM